MAVIQNKATSIGDIIFIKSESSITGVVEFTGFHDLTVGETVDRFFIKRFRYSTNGVSFSIWKELTVANVTSLQVEPYYSIFIELEYERAGTDTTNVLEWHNTIFEGVYQRLPCEYEIGFNSIFFNLLCSNAEVEAVCVNLTEKVYKPGIVPNYVIRNEYGNPADLTIDEDYIAFWKTVSCFFSLFIVFSKKFTIIYSKQEMLSEYLRQRGLFLCGNEELIDLQYLASNFYDEIRQRGTPNIFLKKGHVYPDGSIKSVNGELLRMTCQKKCSEFLMYNIPVHLLSWNIGNSSPTCNGLSNHHSINKGYESWPGVEDLNKYPQINPSVQLLLNYNFNNQNINVNRIRLTNSVRESGIGPNISNLASSDFDKSFCVDENLDYEFSFMFSKITNGNFNEVIDIGVYCFDENNNFIGSEDVTLGGVGTTSTYVTGYTPRKINQEYQINCILYNSSQPLLSFPDNLPNFNSGINLKMKKGVKKVIPYVLFRKTTGATIVTFLFWGLEFKIRNTPWNRYFVNNVNLHVFWVKNNNSLYNDKTLKDNILNYLLNYNSNLEIINL